MPAYNSDNGAAVFILAQPNHVETVQVTMQGQLKEFRRDTIPESDQKILAQMLDIAELPDTSDKAWLEDEDRVSLKEIANKNLVRRNPNVLVVHKEEPVWDKLVQFISSDTDAKLTDVVKKGPAAGTIAASATTNYSLTVAMLCDTS